jgi:perosamine synthetase
MRVPITRPALGTEEADAVAAVLATGMLVQGPRVAEFERLVAEMVGVTHAVAVTNCTAALHLGLLSLGIGPGDVVAVTPYSWVATANVIELCGATPMFVDIDRDTFNLDPSKLTALLAERQDIKAVMPVHTFGNPAGIAEVCDIAAVHGVKVVEDAACALGSSEAGRMAGSMGTVGCFSFHPRKVITTGEGGMLVTDDDELAAFARQFRNHGVDVVDGVPEFVTVGANLRMTEMQGAIGVVQMGRLAGLIAQRTALARRYDEELGRLGMTPQARLPTTAVQSYVALVPEGSTATVVIERLRSNGIESTIGTTAIPFSYHFSQRYGIVDHDLPVTASIRDRAVTLPLYPGMTDEEFAAVLDELEKALQ